MAKRSHSGAIISESDSTPTPQPEIDNGLKRAVDEVLLKYWKSEPEITFFNPNAKKFMSEDEKAGTETMRTEIVACTEFNSELWERACKTAYADITNKSFPHFKVVQGMVNYVLNSDNVDVGLVKNFFSRVLFLHPLNSFPALCYYFHILDDAYVQLHGEGDVKQSVFWFSIDTLITCMKSPEFLTDVKNYLMGLTNIAKKVSLGEKLRFKQSTKIAFRTLKHVDKVQRLLVILEFLCEILELDFLYRTETNRFVARQNRSFLSQILWRNGTDVGTPNALVRKISQIFLLMEKITANQVVNVHKRLLILTAEIFRFDSYRNNLYPFFGINSGRLAGDLALQLFEEFMNNNNNEMLNIIKIIRPHWLRLVVCSKLMTFISCKKYPPELSAVHEILNDLMNLNPQTRDSETFQATKSRLTRQWRKSEESELNLTTPYCYPGCLLQESRESQRKKKLLKFNFNKTDSSDWAPLHRAILLSHEKCVEYILKFNKKPLGNGKYARVDTRLQGFNNYTPLMCAVIKNEAKICRILLEHSGLQLLEDVNVHDETPFELCMDNDIGRMVRSSEKVTSSNQCPKFHLAFEDTPLIAELCVQFVESYNMTHRTREVIDRLKNSSPDPSNLEEQNCWNPVTWDYNRYEDDINFNVQEISKLAETFVGDEKTTNCLQILHLILNYSINF